MTEVTPVEHPGRGPQLNTLRCPYREFHGVNPSEIRPPASPEGGADGGQATLVMGMPQLNRKTERFNGVKISRGKPGSTGQGGRSVEGHFS